LPQRLLWASTGVKDTTAPATLYVQALAAPFTIDTMPEPTLKALSEQTELDAMMATDGSDCEEMLAEFTDAGIGIGTLADRLQEEGAKSFAKSWDSLMTVIASKRESSEKDTAAFVNS
jgi:transaldolase